MMLRAVLCFALLTCVATSADVVPDLAVVRGLEGLDCTESGRQLLKKNGFVVLPRPYHRIFGPYLDHDIPPFITADSVHRTYHVLFEDALEAHETAALPEMLAITEQLAQARANLGESGAPHELVEDYLRVAEALLKDEPAPAGRARVAHELTLIRAEAGIADSPLMGYRVDYSQFAPRGFYVKTPELRAYFRAMAWYGAIAFRLKSAVETDAAMLLADRFGQSADAAERWHRLDKRYTALLSPCDDLTIAEYAALLEEGLTERAAFQAAAWELRDPQYNDMVLPWESMGREAPETKGMRFMGRRYLPDGAVFKAVTYPDLPARSFPSALDVLAANGSVRARVYLREAGTAGHMEALADAQAVLTQEKEARPGSHYMQSLRVMEALTDPPVDQAAPFAKTEAYADKNLVTAAAIWASMRHAWVLMAKQNMMTLGDTMADTLPGYIEPNPRFFERMMALMGTTRDLLAVSDEYLNRRFNEFGLMLVSLRSMLEKQFHGEAFTEAEISFFKYYGKRLARIQDNPISSEKDDDRFPWMGLVADVFTETQSEQCLEVATGPAWPIYAVVDGQLLRGAVYSYYEFQQPIAERLTDSEWHARLDVGALPPPMGFTRSFMAESRSVEAIIADLRKGEALAEAVMVRDPALDDFLVGVVSGTEALESEEHRWHLEQLAVQYIPEQVKPIYLRRLYEDEPPPYQLLDGLYEQWRSGDLSADEYEAAKADLRDARSMGGKLAVMLWNCMDASDFVRLEELVSGESLDRLVWATHVARGVPTKEAESFLLRVLRERRETFVLQEALKQLRLLASKDVTPQLMALCENRAWSFQARALNTIVEIWTRDEMEAMLYRSLPSRASRQELADWEDQLRTWIPAVLAADPSDAPAYSLDLGGLMDILAFLAQIQAVDLHLTLAHVLAQEKVDDANLHTFYFTQGLDADSLGAQELSEMLSIFAACDSRDWLCETITRLGRVGSRADLGVLRSYLHDTRHRSATPSLRNLRVCDFALGAMDHILGVQSPMDWMYSFGKRPPTNQAILDIRRTELLATTEAVPDADRSLGNAAIGE